VPDNTPYLPSTSKVTIIMITTHFAGGTCVVPTPSFYACCAETTNLRPPNRVLHLVFIPLRGGVGQKHGRDTVFIAHRARFSAAVLIYLNSSTQLYFKIDKIAISKLDGCMECVECPR